MGNPHQFRVSQVHESDGKFPLFHERFTGFRVFQIHGTVYLKYTAILENFHKGSGICYQMGLPRCHFLSRFFLTENSFEQEQIKLPLLEFLPFFQ